MSTERSDRVYEYWLQEAVKFDHFVLGLALALVGYWASSIEVMKRPVVYLVPALLALQAVSACGTSPTPAPGEGVFTTGPLQSVEIEDDRRLLVILIAVETLDRPGAKVQVTRPADERAAPFIEATNEASPSDVRLAFSTLGLMFARHPHPPEGAEMRAHVEPMDSISFSFDDDPFFVHTSRALEAVRASDSRSVVGGYGEARAVLVRGRISELVGNARVRGRE